MSITDDVSPRRNGDRLIFRASPYLLTALLGGGGFSVGMPLAWPELYRQDPATGTELAELKRDVDQLEEQFAGFLIRGPEQVRAKLDELIGIQRELVGVAQMMVRNQTLHAQRTESIEQSRRERDE